MFRKLKNPGKQAIRRAEDWLKHLYFAETDHTGFGTEQVPAGLLRHKKRSLEILRQHGWIEGQGDKLQLTDAGRKHARNLVRRHRLFETWLARHTGHQPTHWHRLAELKEHELSDEQVREMEARLGAPLLDPHGDPIPALDGSWHPTRHIPLHRASDGQILRILHLEDEPQSLLQQLLNYGFYPGALLKVLGRARDNLHLAFEGHRIILPLELARHIAVTPVDAGLWNEKIFKLSFLPKGATACIVRLADDLHGLTRQRLLDLGFVPGARVSVYLISPLGDPTAYDIKGSTVALRSEQSGKILVELCED